ncbi:uncharacterized protein [Antedon mediterranea]
MQSLIKLMSTEKGTSNCRHHNDQRVMDGLEEEVMYRQLMRNLPRMVGLQEPIVDVIGNVEPLKKLYEEGKRSVLESLELMALFMSANQNRRANDVPTLIACRRCSIQQSDYEEDEMYFKVCSPREGSGLLVSHVENTLMAGLNESEVIQRLKQVGRENVYMTVPHQPRNNARVADFLDASPSDLPVPLITWTEDSVWVLMACVCLYTPDKTIVPGTVQLFADDGSLYYAIIAPFAIGKRYSQTLHTNRGSVRFLSLDSGRRMKWGHGLCKMFGIPPRCFPGGGEYKRMHSASAFRGSVEHKIKRSIIGSFSTFVKDCLEKNE